MKLTADLLSTVSTVLFILAVVFLVLAVTLFIVFRIPDVVGDLSGKTAKNSIRQIREENEKSARRRGGASDGKKGKKKNKKEKAADEVDKDVQLSRQMYYDRQTGRGTQDDSPQAGGMQNRSVQTGRTQAGDGGIQSNAGYAAYGGSAGGFRGNSEETEVLGEETAVLGEETAVLGEETEVLKSRGFSAGTGGYAGSEETALLDETDEVLYDAPGRFPAGPGETVVLNEAQPGVTEELTASSPAPEQNPPTQVERYEEVILVHTDEEIRI